MPSIYSVDPAEMSATASPRREKPGVETKRTLCATCDVSCNVVTEVKKGRVVRVRSSDNPIFRDNICMKGIVAPKAFAHPNRLMHPLKRVGERGSGEWEQVSWDEAMSDIAARLQTIIDRDGPEAWAVSTSQWNTATDHGLGRRLMNHVGSPNWISGVALCAGNTAAINRLTYGWFPFADFPNTNCIVLIGHNPRRNSWVPVYNQIRRAQARGAKLIVLDPRKSSNAERADVWLPLRAGTDTVMLFGWLKVIFDEGLYDKDFVENWTVGFEELRARVDEFPLDRVAKITGCDPDQIRKAARIYATHGPAVIPWTPITDMQRNSTSGIRLQSILRSVCGVRGRARGRGASGFSSERDPRVEDRSARGALRGAEGEAARFRHAPGLHVSGTGGAARAHEAGLGLRIHQPGHRMLHGQSVRDVSCDGRGGAVSGQSVLLPREQHASEFRQHAAHSERNDEPRTHRRSRAVHDADCSARGLRASRRQLAGAAVVARQLWVELDGPTIREVDGTPRRM